MTTPSYEEPTYPQGTHTNGMPKAKITAGSADSEITLTPGENVISSENFMYSLVLFWLHSHMELTNRRFVGKYPKTTFFGLIPTGFEEHSVPLKAISSISVSQKVRLGRIIIGVVSLFIAMMVTQASMGLALLFLLVALLFLAQAFRAVLSVKTTAGMPVDFAVSIFEKSKLEKFKQTVEQQLYSGEL